MKIFRHLAEVCPVCGAVASFRKGANGKSLTIGRERRVYVTCTKCGARALRVTELPKDYPIS